MPKHQKIPEGYKSLLSLRETEKAVKMVKDNFEGALAKELGLERVSAPRFVQKGTGINDDLNGTERKVTFEILQMPGVQAEMVFSLAKWKRAALADYGFESGTGLYTDMDAIRPDEEKLDNLHSIYVDQWDWEKAIRTENRTLDFLEATVRKIYKTLKDTEEIVHKQYPMIKPQLPEEITFVHTEDLIEQYPQLGSNERERKAAEKHGAIFVVGIGGKLNDGSIHDGRAPDYDDWSTPSVDDKRGLNGDIILWHPVLKQEFEISSMGIRVDKEALKKQLKIRGLENRMEYDWHKRLLAGEFPESIGGGIGQSRLCMYFLKKAHIGEVQASLWPTEVRKYCSKNKIHLL